MPPCQRALGFPNEGRKVITEKIADPLNGKIRRRERGDDRGIIGVLTLARQYGRHAVAPDRLYRGQNTRFVVDEHVMAGRIALFDVLQFLFLMDVDQHIAETVSYIPERSTLRG